MPEGESTWAWALEQEAEQFERFFRARAKSAQFVYWLFSRRPALATVPEAGEYLARKREYDPVMLRLRGIYLMTPPRRPERCLLTQALILKRNEEWAERALLVALDRATD